MTKCEIFLAVNENGEYEVRADESEARGALDENIGGTCCKIVKLVVSVTAPAIETVEVTVPDTAGKTTAIAE